MRTFIDRFGGLLALALLGSSIAWSQVPTGTPARLQLQSLGIGAAPPAGTGSITTTGTVTAGVDLNATAGTMTSGNATVTGTATIGTMVAVSNCTVAGSRCNTIANTGRVATVTVTGATGATVRSLNSTSTTRTGLGTYSWNNTAAGFTASPICTCSGVTSTSYAICTVAGAASVSVTTFNSSGVAADLDHAVICVGI